jgi:proline dehydrogenase
MEVTTNPIFENVSIAFSSKTDKQLQKAYFLFSIMNRKWLVNLGKFGVNLGFALKLPISGIIRETIYDQFCGGIDIPDSQGTIDELAKFNIGSILDYSVEGADSDKGFEETTQEIRRTIDRASGDEDIPFCVFKITGIAMTDVFAKVQNKEKLNEKEQVSFDASKERIESICKYAHDNNVRIFVDAEESWIQETVDVIVYEMMSKYNKKEAIVYNTYQMYRRDMFDNLKEAHKNAKEQGYHLGLKLVRGAYMEKEAERAERLGYPNPIQVSKAATDLDYNRALEYCVENIDNIGLCSGSHNQYSNYFLTVLMEKHGLSPDDERIYFAQLYGMSDNISFNLSDKGYKVAKYVPYGPVKSVMPYLLRRAEENTAMAGQSSREFLLIKEEIQRRKQNK